MKREIAGLCAGAILVTGCPVQAPRELQSAFRPITLGELRQNSERFLHERVAFSAAIERVEEVAGGTWLYLRDGDEKVVLHTTLGFGGSLRESLDAGDRMQFEVEVGEKKLTSFGAYAIEVLPYQISKTTYFDQPVPIEPPKPVE